MADKNDRLKTTFVKLQKDPMEDMVFIRALGSGGFADVYLARDLKRKHEVAVKILQRLNRTEPLMMSFQEEFAKAAKVTHKNCLTVFRSGWHLLPYEEIRQGQVIIIEKLTPWFSMEYIENAADLSDLIKEYKGKVPLDMVIPIARQIAEAVSAIHRAQLIHCDLKPENIMIVKEGNNVTVKVCDFGIAVFIKDRENACITGTMGYMAPEHIDVYLGKKDASNLTFAADYWSFGIILHELLVGYLPFQISASIEKHREELVKFIAAIGDKNAPFLSADCPEQIKKILVACFIEDPADRMKAVNDKKVLEAVSL